VAASDDGGPSREARGRPSGISSRELALRSGPVLDVPRRTAVLLTIGGIAGAALVVMESLTGGRRETMEVDKLLHFAGYAVLALVFVLGLSPRRFVPVLLGLALLGVAIEVVQTFNQRAFEWRDAAADVLGLAVGAGTGPGVRWLYGFVKTELDAARVRGSLVSYQRGETIVRQGDTMDTFLILKEGAAHLYREEAGARRLVDRAGAGDMIEVLAEIQGRPAYATVVATAPTRVYRLDLDALIEVAGGRRQPLGAVLEALARDLREAWDRIAELEARLASTPDHRPPATPAPQAAADGGAVIP
jgi:hypothetical protein